MSAQLDLLSWNPPKAKSNLRGKRRFIASNGIAAIAYSAGYIEYDGCKCDAKIGFIGVWRDKRGIDHVECDLCRSRIRFPCCREARP